MLGKMVSVEVLYFVRSKNETVLEEKASCPHCSAVAGAL